VVKGVFEDVFSAINLKLNSSAASAYGLTLIDDADAAAARTTLGLVIGTNVQAQDAELAAIAGLTSAADRLPYFTGSGTAALATFTAAGRALIDDADAAAQRTTLGLVIGTNVQAQDAELSAIAGLTSAADRLPYFTGLGTAALATFTTAGRALIDDADAAAQRTTLGLAIGTNVQAYDAGLQSIAGLTTAADRGIYTTASDTYAVYTLTAAGRAILDDADATAQRTTLGLGTAATVNTGTSGATIPLLNTANTFSAAQTVSASGQALTVSGATDPYIVVSDTTTPTSLFLQAVDTQVNVGSTTNHPLGLYSNSVQRLTVAAAGDFSFTSDPPGPTNERTIGFRGAPRNRQDSSYTLVLADAGKSIVGYGSTASQTWTIPANGSVAYPIGTSVTFINMRSVACSIACTTDTMYLAGTGATGTRTLASYGWCTAVKTDTTNWIVGGTGLT
jgi:hypothetical protein